MAAKKCFFGYRHLCRICAFTDDYECHQFDETIKQPSCVRMWHVYMWVSASVCLCVCVCAIIGCGSCICRTSRIFPILLSVHSIWCAQVIGINYGNSSIVGCIVLGRLLAHCLTVAPKHRQTDKYTHTYLSMWFKALRYEHGKGICCCCCYCWC